MITFDEFLRQEPVEAISEAKEMTFAPKDVTDAKLIKVGETFMKDGKRYKVTVWSKDEIKAKEDPIK